MTVHPDYPRAECHAEKLLSKYDIFEPIVNVFYIAQKEGFTIQYFEPTGKLENVSGFYDPKTKIIYVNRGDPPTRQVFTVAHELGHALLNHKEDSYGVLWRLATPIDKEPAEQEANCFAANLLVPKTLLEQVMTKYQLTKEDVSILAGMFGVSPVVMKFRLRAL